MPKTIVTIFVSLILSSCLSTNYEMNTAQKPISLEGLSIATFAGGCFWCMESNFESIEGVKEVISGYAGGNTSHPSYKRFKSGNTGHTETVQIYYDKTVVNYQALLEWYWRSVNPTDTKGQFADRGNQYRPAIYFGNDEEKMLALVSQQRLNLSGRYTAPISLEIAPLKAFYPAKEFHQNYYLKHPTKYRFYRAGSGRDQYLKKIWHQNYWKH